MTLAEIRDSDTPEARAVREQMQCNHEAAADAGCDLYGYPLYPTGLDYVSQPQDLQSGDEWACKLAETPLTGTLPQSYARLHARIAELKADAFEACRVANELRAENEALRADLKGSRDAMDAICKADDETFKAYEDQIAALKAELAAYKPVAIGTNTSFPSRALAQHRQDIGVRCR